MNIPTDGTKIHDHPLATFWFDHRGILHKVSKNTQRNPENVKDLYSRIKRIAHGKKVCALIECSKEAVSYKETRDYLKKEIPETFKAVAFITSTSLGKMIGTLMSVLAPTHVPAKVFTEEEEAKKWLQDYIHLC